MRELEATLDDVFLRQERLTRDEIHRRAVAAEAPNEVINALDGLPEGEYALDEVVEALSGAVADTTMGVPPNELENEDLMRELWEIHRTRHDTFRHGSDDALINHNERMADLEAEYLRRWPEREVDPERLREGARLRRHKPGRILALEDSDEVEQAIEDDAPVASLASGAPRRDSEFLAPGEEPPVRTGAEQPWEPRDYAIAAGKDPTPENIEWARRVLEKEGPAAIERIVP